MDVDPIGTAARTTSREDRLGRDSVCVICGEADLALLSSARVKITEEHHVLGRRHDEGLTTTFCKNHHALIHERYAQAGVDLKAQPTFLERLLQMLRSLAVFFQMLGEALSNWAKSVDRLIHQLDERCPQWRTIE